jgi:hypothetical protein
MGPDFERFAGARAATAVTPEEVKAAREFNQAMAEIAIQFANLGRLLLVELEPGILAFIRMIEYVIATVHAIKEDWLTPWKIPEDRQKYLDELMKNFPIGKQGELGVPIAPGMAPEGLVQSILRHEGSGETSVSSAGAIGRFQVMPSTGAKYLQPGEDLRDPKVNERVGRAIIADLWNKYRDAKAVMIAYNAGEGVADRWIASGKDDSILPHETRNYVSPGYAGGVPSIGGGAGQAAMRPNVQGMLGGIRSNQYAALAPSMAANTNTTANFGDIHVYTQATDGAGVTRAIREAIARNMLVGQANTGLA